MNDGKFNISEYLYNTSFIAKSVNYTLGSIAVFLYLFFFLGIIITGGKIITDPSLLKNIVIPAIYIVILIFGLGIFSMLYKNKFYHKKVSEIQKYQEYLKRLEGLCKSSTQNIDEVLKIANISHNILIKLITLKNRQENGETANKEVSQFIQEHYQYIFNILSNIRHDLHVQFIKHGSILKQAKSSLSTHIHGTSELNQVSELQRQRLDQQIAQFEELQRVLVKV